MGIFQAPMLKVMQSLWEDFQKSLKKITNTQEAEVDQISTSASRPGPSKTIILDPSLRRPRPTSHSVEEMEVDYGPPLPPRLGADHSKCVNDASDQQSGIADEPSRVVSIKLKTILTLI